MTINHVVKFLVFVLMVGGALLAGRSRRHTSAEPPPRVVRRWQTRQFWRWFVVWWTLPR